MPLSLSRFLAAIALLPLAPPALAETISIDFEAEAATVVGLPFGLDIPRLTLVSGTFHYDSAATDQLPDDPMRGAFDLAGNAWGFTANFLGHQLTGSPLATASTETFGHTLRFEDGTDMAFDEVARADLALTLSLVAGATELPTDALPAPFRYDADDPHTFVLEDDAGRMLLQFNWLHQRPRIKSLEHNTASATITWCSVEGQSYTLEHSADLATWTTIATVTGDAGETSATDQFADRLGKGAPSPSVGHYRIRPAAPPSP